LPHWFLVGFLLMFMAVKAVMIAGNFMHLRHEHRNLAVMVGAGIVVTSLILYTYVSYESKHVLELTAR
jgi:cytochrome c oxidase subunit IV